MRVSINGGTAQPVGPPGFGRLNDIHAHKTGFGPSGEALFYLKILSIVIKQAKHVEFIFLDAHKIPPSYSQF